MEKTNIPDVNELLSYWNEKAEEIKKQSFNDKQGEMISQQFASTFKPFLQMTNTEVDEILFHKVMANLLLALHISFSNYRKEKRSFWSFIFRSSLAKIPKINLEFPKH